MTFMTRGGTPRTWRALLFLATALVVLAALRFAIERPLGGSIRLAFPESTILRLRLTAIASASAVGAALGVAGAMLQALLRNPLADPFILGVSGGAGLGVTIALALAWSVPALTLGEAWWAQSLVQLLVHMDSPLGTVAPAAIGAIAALGLVALLGQRRGAPDPLALVLAGVVVATMCGAVVLLLQHLSPQGLRADLASWMLGRIPETIDPVLLGVVAALALGGIVVGVSLGRAMDAATFGDDEAHSLGVPLRRLRWTLGIVAGVLAAASVTIAGPIAFVGLVAPHIVRSLAGARHAPLVFGSAVMGAALLVGADVLRQVIDLGGGRIPVGIFTALAGGPLFLVLLRRGRGLG